MEPITEAGGLTTRWLVACSPRVLLLCIAFVMKWFGDWQQVDSSNKAGAGLDIYAPEVWHYRLEC